MTKLGRDKCVSVWHIGISMGRSINVKESIDRMWSKIILISIQFYISL